MPSRFFNLLNNQIEKIPIETHTPNGMTATRPRIMAKNSNRTNRKVVKILEKDYYAVITSDLIT